MPRRRAGGGSDERRSTIVAADDSCADDSCAAGAVMALREDGLRVPEDIPIVGYDDVSMAAHMWPPLTTVHVPAEELGRTAARMASHANAIPLRETILGTHIVVRQSVARRVA